MTDSTLEVLGPPAVQIVGLRLWVHGHQFPDAPDHWDADRLNVTVHCSGQGGSVWASGPLLDTAGIFRFRQGLEAIYRTLRGMAELSSREPHLVVRVKASDDAGHLLVRVEITPDHLTQGHWFEFGIDQTYLPP